MSAENEMMGHLFVCVLVLQHVFGWQINVAKCIQTGSLY